MRYHSFVLVAMMLALASPLSADDLLIDPRLIAESAEVWSCIASADNKVWPGWNASDTPLLFYLPGRQDVLINHPKPPEDFRPYNGPIRFPGGDIHIRTGRTLFDFDGQNTSTSVKGVETLVVADTLSNHRSRMMALMNDSRTADEKLPAGEYELLMEEFYGQMAMIAHEAFHVYQQRKAPDKGGNELALKSYPVLSVPNNVGFALKGKALAKALRAESDEACREAAIAWLAVRRDRRGWLVPEAAVAATPKELELALTAAMDGPIFETLVESKSRLEADGKTHVEKMVSDILKGSHTLLTIDYSGLNNPQVAMSFTPFGITGVDKNRTVYRMVPVKVRFKRGYGFSQTSALPLLHDEKEKCFHFQLMKTLSQDDLPGADADDKIDLELPGVRIQAGKASFEWKGNTLVVKLLPG